MTGTYRSRIVLLAVSQTNQANVLVPKKKKKMKPVLVEKANMITTLFFSFLSIQTAYVLVNVLPGKGEFKQPIYYHPFKSLYGHRPSPHIQGTKFWPWGQIML